MTIWKYTLENNIETIEMPKDAEILAVQEQGGAANIWAKVDPKAGKENRTFVIYGTGQSFSDKSQRYLGTVQIGVLVFHVFELVA